MCRRVAMVWLGGLVAAGAGWAGPRNLRDELRSLPAETGISVAIISDGKLRIPHMASPEEDWAETGVPGAAKHTLHDDGTLSPDGTLAAFPYYEARPCLTWRNCDPGADKSIFLAIIHIDGSEVIKYPHVIRPSEMCWTRDNSKLAMVAQSATDAHRQLLVLDLNTDNVKRVADGKFVAITPQCWSPGGKQLVYFVGEKDWNRPGAIRITDIETLKYRDLLIDRSRCKEGDIMCASPYPTWSPDGDWIAYLQHKAYWAIHPSGKGRKKIFRSRGALSPLQWSPDTRFALYADCCALLDTLRCMCEIGRIRVMRLSDHKKIEIASDGFQDMFIPRWTWIQQKRPR